MEIRDGGSPNSPLVGRYCGGSIPPEYVSSGSRVYVRFKTDHSVAHDGFRIAYEIGKYWVTHQVVFQVLLISKLNKCCVSVQGDPAPCSKPPVNIYV